MQGVEPLPQVEASVAGRRIFRKNIVQLALNLAEFYVGYGRVGSGDERRIPAANYSAAIIAVDEFPPGGRGAARRMCTAVVEARADVYEPAYRLLFSDGTSITASVTPRTSTCSTPAPDSWS